MRENNKRFEKGQKRKKTTSRETDVKGECEKKLRIRYESAGLRTNNANRRRHPYIQRLEIKKSKSNARDMKEDGRKKEKKGGKGGREYKTSMVIKLESVFCFLTRRHSRPFPPQRDKSETTKGQYLTVPKKQLKFSRRHSSAPRLVQKFVFPPSLL